MTKYVECWGADRPFANIAESKLVKNIGLAVSNTLKPLKKNNGKKGGCEMIHNNEEDNKWILEKFSWLCYPGEAE